MIDAIETLLKSESEKLRDREYVCYLIRQHGLHNDPSINHFYGIENQPYLVGNGMLQIPEQLADALIWLSDKAINQYLEIGTFNGKTTVFITTYLSKFNPGMKAMTLDIMRQWHNPYPELNIVSLIGTSDSWKGFQSDLCFIDGDHSLEWVRKDHQNVGKYAKYCMFHDILEDELIRKHKMEVPLFWKETKKPSSQEFTFGGRMGIGIL